jgi:Mn-dependent DtxR family transcriptional regulator
VLKRLLEEVATGRIGSTAELATALGASSAMVAAMVDELERRKLLHRAGNCGSSCTACPAGTECAPKARASAWMLTAAGRRHAER